MLSRISLCWISLSEVIPMAITLRVDEVLARARSRTACTKCLVTPTRRALVKIQAPEIVLKSSQGISLYCNVFVCQVALLTVLYLRGFLK